MYSVELMINEHEYILAFIGIIKNACCGILEGKEIDTEDFKKMILFARNYADKHHHGKEERILFAEMTNHLGKIGTNLIQHGMLVEHDLGRLHISDLEKAIEQYKEEHKTIYKLDIVVGAAGYANLLKRHIDKEDEVVYSYAEKNLSADILESIDDRVRDFEKSANKEHIQDKYLTILKELQDKYQ